jgi:hypothetical protein
MKREILCPGCDAELVKVVPPTYPKLNRELEGIRRRRGRARLPLRCDHCNHHIDVLGACVAWSIYRGGPGRDHLPPGSGEYFEWEATRLELGPPMPGLPGWTCTGCESELEIEDAAQVIVRERIGPPAGVPGEVKEREIALPGSYHRWCAEAATALFYNRQRHQHGFEGCHACEFGRLKPCPALGGDR